MKNIYIEKIEDCLDRALRDSNDQEIVVTEIGMIQTHLASLKGHIGGLEQALKRRQNQILQLDEDVHEVQRDLRRAEKERDNALADDDIPFG